MARQKNILKKITGCDLCKNDFNQTHKGCLYIFNFIKTLQFRINQIFHRRKMHYYYKRRRKKIGCVIQHILRYEILSLFYFYKNIPRLGNKERNQHTNEIETGREREREEIMQLKQNFINRNSSRKMILDQTRSRKQIFYADRIYRNRRYFITIPIYKQ